MSDVDRYHTQPAAALLAAAGVDAANVFGLRLEHWVPDVRATVAHARMLEKFAHRIASQPLLSGISIGKGDDKFEVGRSLHTTIFPNQ